MYKYITCHRQIVYYRLHYRFLYALNFIIVVRSIYFSYGLYFNLSEWLHQPFVDQTEETDL